MLYFVIGVSRGSNFFTDAKIKVRKILKIPWISSEVHRTFSRNPWKNFNVKEKFLSEDSNSIFSFISCSFVYLNFFKSLLEVFLWTLQICSRYRYDLLDLDLCVSKKIGSARHANQILCQEKWKQLRFWKNETKNGVETFWQKLCFLFWATMTLHPTILPTFDPTQDPVEMNIEPDASLVSNLLFRSYWM